MTKVELRHISNEYILRDVNLTVQDGQLLVLLGPTGAGKTTLLNVIAGIVNYEGNVLFDGENVDGKPANRRDVGYIFQELALFPHLDVAANIAYGMKMRNKSPSEISEKVDEMLGLMKIEHLRHRYPGDLSGGEKQRVALARALAFSPKILLLDEPLNNLDQTSRRYLRAEIHQIQRQLGTTTLFVTHDVEEAKELGDAIAIIVNGTVRQVGTPNEVFSRPLDSEIADLIGCQNILECSSYKRLREGLYEVNCKGTKIVVTSEGSVINRITIPAREIHIYAEEPIGPRVNTYRGTVLEIIQYSPSTLRVKIQVGENVFIGELPKDVFDNLHLTVGKQIFIKLKLKAIRAYM